MRKHILCLGDSNTHGYCAQSWDCEDGIRFNEDERWPKLMEKQLGESCYVTEEGLSGRTTVFSDPLEENMDALSYIYGILKSHKPIDLMIVMLGTNDTKERFGANACCIAEGMARLLKKALTVDCWRDDTPNILLVSPPPIEDGLYTSYVVGTMGAGCVEKSRQLEKEYRKLAEAMNIHFISAAGCELNDTDFMHLTKKGHKQLADKMTDAVRSIMEEI